MNTVREVQVEDVVRILNGLLPTLGLQRHQGGLEQDVRDYARQLARILGNDPKLLLAVGVEAGDKSRQATELLRHVWAEVDGDEIPFWRGPERLQGWLEILLRLTESPSAPVLTVTLKELSMIAGIGAPTPKTMHNDWDPRPKAVGKRGREDLFSYRECIPLWPHKWPVLPSEEHARQILQSVQLGTEAR